MIRCNECNVIPDAEAKIKWKCNSCGKIFQTTYEQLHTFAMKKQSNTDKSFLKCKYCGNALDDGNESMSWKCSCGNEINCKLIDFAEKEEQPIEHTQSNLIKCPECGNEVVNDVNICPSCGYEIIPSETGTQETTDNRVVPIYENKKYIRIVLFVAACILFIIAFTRINNDTYSFYKQHYKECMEGYADSKAAADNYSGWLFKGSYERIASSYEDMARDDNKKIWEYRIQAIILCLGGFVCGFIGYRLVKGEMYNGISKMS